MFNELHPSLSLRQHEQAVAACNQFPLVFFATSFFQGFVDRFNVIDVCLHVGGNIASSRAKLGPTGNDSPCIQRV